VTVLPVHHLALALAPDLAPDLLSRGLFLSLVCAPYWRKMGLACRQAVESADTSTINE
jgi:hypothetical protein